MRLPYSLVMDLVRHDLDAAIDAGWTPAHWEGAGGFESLCLARLPKVGDLRLLAARLGSSTLVRQLKDCDPEEWIDFYAEYV
jgi:hypothetical protein